MTDTLKRLLQQHTQRTDVAPLGQLAVFQCHTFQRLHSVPIHQPTIILVLAGEKRLTFKQQSYRCQSGQIFLIPANSQIQLENIPDAQQQEYLALCVSFSPQTISRFLQQYSQLLPNSRKGTYNPNARTASSDLLFALEQRVKLCLSSESQNQLQHEFRQQELLAICAENDILTTLIHTQQPSWKQQVANLLASDVSHEWRIDEVCQTLATSESSLRRSLLKEDTCFREILEETRLISALCLLQETPIQITALAAKVGYQSPSRFSARFKRRFGMTPTQLKKSRQKPLNPESLTLAV
ncbi:MAG: helix-turn-helix domain-containing protein [Pseudomonadales bacterium]|nr:helix-turn-helix domain-containing protein [Pseudomonadales bacterium]